MTIMTAIKLWMQAYTNGCTELWNESLMCKGKVLLGVNRENIAALRLNFHSDCAVQVQAYNNNNNKELNWI